MTFNAKYIDAFNTNSAHEMFNASLVLMCSYIFESVECRVSQSNFQAIKQLLNANTPKNITYKAIYVPQGNGKIVLLFRYILGAISNAWQLIVTPKNTIIVYPFNNLFGLRLINALNKLCRKHVLIFCHGEMEGLSPDAIRAGLLSKLLIRLARNFFLNPKINPSKGLYFSVMGETILDNLSTLISTQFKDRFISVDHPYIFNAFTIPELAKTSPKIEMGTAGAMNQTKGLDTYLELVNSLSSDIRSKVSFSITGRVFNDLSRVINTGIDVPDNNENISRECFDARIAKLDYLLFFYPSKSYKITASGAIMDAIYHQKPIIALKTDYFQYLFKRFGTFGYLCESIYEMKEKLNEIVISGRTQNVDFDAIKMKLTPQFISGQMRDELHRIGLI